MHGTCWQYVTYTGHASSTCYMLAGHAISGQYIVYAHNAYSMLAVHGISQHALLEICSAKGCPPMDGDFLHKNVLGCEFMVVLCVLVLASNILGVRFSQLYMAKVVWEPMDLLGLIWQEKEASSSKFITASCDGILPWKAGMQHEHYICIPQDMSSKCGTMHVDGKMHSLCQQARSTKDTCWSSMQIWSMPTYNMECETTTAYMASALVL